MFNCHHNAELQVHKKCPVIVAIILLHIELTSQRRVCPQLHEEQEPQQKPHPHRPTKLFPLRFLLRPVRIVCSPDCF